ncbi:MAG: hypothetical protein QN122_05400 [Armatimonadota bacterium]|nr:hypothetical protein [Armatimonadota bacterium]MDR7449893.1 hypothetical protein [Armatimonadota bacterium]MDR7460710.1 hypothetical protein [Armatimonadota bacterium]MDR7479701.1 hypothetical protein [Armatimonadota bacterium]MDR7487838.1 hypothetical protein [Armatimonadota bacterium]
MTTPPARPWHEFRTRIALAIAAVSVLGAVAAWHAAVTASAATDLDQQAVQERLRYELRLLEQEGIVNQDLRFAVRYQEHLKAWRLLRRAAAEARATPPLARALDTQAHAELALARALRPYFRGAQVSFGDGDGTFSYDRAYVLRQNLAHDSVLAELRPDALRVQAERAHLRAWWLVGVVTLFVAALVLLTLAELGGARVRGLFARTGTGLAGVALVLWGVVGTVTR